MTHDAVHCFFASHAIPQDQRCRLLDLIPSDLRGQPHHYICHAWGCSSQELLATLKREMLPPAPPRPPPLSMQRGGGGGGGAGGGGPAANGKASLAAAAGGLHGVRRVGGGAGAGAGGGAAGGKVAGGLAPGTHLPSLNAGAMKGESGGAGGGGAAAGDGTNALYASIAGSQEAVWRHYEEMMAKYKVWGTSQCSAGERKCCKGLELGLHFGGPGECREPV